MPHTSHLALPLPGAWEVMTLLALSAAAASALLFCANTLRQRRSPLPDPAARLWLLNAAACTLPALAGLIASPGRKAELPALRFHAPDWSAEGLLCLAALLLCALAALWRSRGEARPGWGVLLPLALAAAGTLATIPQALRLCLLHAFSLPPLWPLYMAVAGLSAACGLTVLRRASASPLCLDSARQRLFCGIMALVCALAGALITPAAAVSVSLGWRLPEYAATVCAMLALFCWRWPRLAPLSGGVTILAGLLLLWKALFLRQAVTTADASQQMSLALHIADPWQLLALAACALLYTAAAIALHRVFGGRQ